MTAEQRFEAFFFAGLDARTTCSLIFTALLYSTLLYKVTHPSKRKGNTYERELVDEAEAAGLEAERAYASDGRSLGEGKECDVLIRGREAMILDALRIQAKRRKNIAQYLTPPEAADITVVRENYGESLAIVPWELFLQLLKNATDEDEGR